MLNRLRLSGSILVVVTLLLQFSSVPVLALSQLDTDAINGPWVNWDPSGVGTSACLGSSLGGSIDQFLQATAIHESGGNITAGSPGHASGKYQIEPATWHGYSSQHYTPGLQYPFASAAPENVQDAVAYLANISEYKKFNGDSFWMAINWYQPSATKAYPNKSDPSLNVVPAGGNNLTYKQYGDIIANAVSSGQLNGKQLSSIKLSYTSAPDFEIWLAKAGGAPAASGPSVASSSGCSGTGIANFVFYNQCDPKWTSHPYGDPGKTICSSGCGPSSVAMVVATLINSSIDPPQVADWSMANGGWVSGAGSSWGGLLINGSKHYGLNAQDLGTDLNKAIATLNGGGLVIAAGNGAVPFTQDGHILVLKGIASNGNILVADPDTAHTQTEYSPAAILTAGLRDLVGVTK